MLTAPRTCVLQHGALRVRPVVGDLLASSVAHRVDADCDLPVRDPAVRSVSPSHDSLLSCSATKPSMRRRRCPRQRHRRREAADVTSLDRGMGGHSPPCRVGHAYAAGFRRLRGTCRSRVERAVPCMIVTTCRILCDAFGCGDSGAGPSASASVDPAECSERSPGRRPVGARAVPADRPTIAPRRPSAALPRAPSERLRVQRREQRGRGPRPPKPSVPATPVVNARSGPRAVPLSVRGDRSAKWQEVAARSPLTEADTATGLAPDPGSEPHATLDPYAVEEAVFEAAAARPSPGRGSRFLRASLRCPSATTPGRFPARRLLASWRRPNAAPLQGGRAAPRTRRLFEVEVVRECAQPALLRGHACAGPGGRRFRDSGGRRRGSRPRSNFR